MSIFTGMTSQEKLGGVFGLSCYLLMANKVKDMIPKETPNKDTPFFMGHGDSDPLVKYAWGQRTAEKLREYGYKVDFKSYRGLVHSAAPEEIDDVENFLNKCLPLEEGAAGTAS